MRGGPRGWVVVKWLGTPRCTLTIRERQQPSSKVSKILKPYTNGIRILEFGINPVSVDTALRTKDKALSHVPPLCSYITRITRILISHCVARILAVCTRVDLEITVLREVDILPAWYASSGCEGRVKEDLWVANQTYNELRLDSRWVLGIETLDQP